MTLKSAVPLLTKTREFENGTLPHFALNQKYFSMGPRIPSSKGLHATRFLYVRTLVVATDPELQCFPNPL